MRPTFDFGMIVFNGEFLLHECLASVYDFAHHILVVEGAVEQTIQCLGPDSEEVTPDGHSTDRTLEILADFPDPESKIRLIQKDGPWRDKTEMCNAYVPYIDADYIWQLDADEFYHRGDMERLRDYLAAHPETTAVNFFTNHFWGDWDHITCAEDPATVEGFWGNQMAWPRVFRHEPGSRWKNHAPPKYLSGTGVDQGARCLLGGHGTLEMGIRFYHYGYVDRGQVAYKSAYHAAWVTRKLTDWDNWQLDHSIEVVAEGTYTCPFVGEHPEAVLERVRADAPVAVAATPEIDTPVLDLTGDRGIEWTWVRERIGNGPGRALDFGPAGSDLGFLAAEAGFRVLALDMAWTAPAQEHADLEFMNGDLLEMQLPAEAYDLVINCSTVEHVGLAGRYGVTEPSADGDLEAMRKLQGAMKPGGRMILTIPVGRDEVYEPLHRVYGVRRLPDLLDGFDVEEEGFWVKNALNEWVRTDKITALNFPTQKMLYGLGCMVLTRPETAT
ncbi:MAG: DUF268 domain-containing protein [Coriobacteriia bacterium]|nr:DUF268 domain-containing protein [Coriobacteriia bacterium]